MHFIIVIAAGLILSAFQVFPVQASEALKGAKKDFQEFRTEMAVKLDILEAQLGSAKVAAQKKGDEAKIKTTETLQETRRELREKLDRAQVKGRKAWAKFKEDFATSVDHLNNKIQTNLKD